MAFTVTFPTTAGAPHPTDVAGWLTEQGEPFESEGPHSLALRAIPVRFVFDPEGAKMQAQIELTRLCAISRMVDLMFNISVRAGSGVRLLGSGDVTRGQLWLRLADEQARIRLARALAESLQRSNHNEVLSRMWGALQAMRPGHDVRWDANRETIVELREVDAPDGISKAEAEWHAENPEPGDAVGLPVNDSLHLLVWCWLTEAYPGLSELS